MENKSKCEHCKNGCFFTGVKCWCGTEGKMHNDSIDGLLKTLTPSSQDEEK